MPRQGQYCAGRSLQTANYYDRERRPFPIIAECQRRHRMYRWMRSKTHQQALSKPHGIHFDPRMKYTMQMFEEYTASVNGGKPKKKSGDLLHGVADAFQYTMAYINDGGETFRPEPVKRKKKPKRSKVKYR